MTLFQEYERGFSESELEGNVGLLGNIGNPLNPFTTRDGFFCNNRL